MSINTHALPIIKRLVDNFATNVEVASRRSENAMADLAVASSNGADSAENGKEEYAAHVASSVGKNQAKEKPRMPATSIKKRVSDVKAIQDLIETLNAEKDINNLSEEIREKARDRDKFPEFLQKQLEKEVEPALIYIAIHKAGLNKDGGIQDKFSKLADDFLSMGGVHSAIHTTLNIGAALTKKILDPEIATSLRKLIHEKSQDRKGPADILADVLIHVGNEKYDTLLKAYRDALVHDLAASCPSADESYLAETSARLSNIASTTSLLDMCNDMLPSVNRLLDKDAPRCDQMKLTKGICRLVTMAGSDDYSKMIDQVATKIMGTVNATKKADGVNKLVSLALKMPVSFWTDDSLRNHTIAKLREYVGRGSSNIFGVASKHRLIGKNTELT
jgi:hypothetical protein